jgi:hypothetical protein
MATELEQTLFEDELQMVQNLPEARRWQLERDNTVPLGLFAVMHPISKSTELYKARIRWTDYFGPFSMKFINTETGVDTDPKAWPRCFGFRPGSLDACLPWTAEGHTLHPEWKNSGANAFPRAELPLQHALLRIQLALDTSYEGRGNS